MRDSMGQTAGQRQEQTSEMAVMASMALVVSWNFGVVLPGQDHFHRV